MQQELTSRGFCTVKNELLLKYTALCRSLNAYYFNKLYTLQFLKSFTFSRTQLNISTILRG